METKDVLFELTEKGYQFFKTGSRVTTHFTKSSDWDYVVYDPTCDLEKGLETSSHWVRGGSNRLESPFDSFKTHGINGTVTNLILVQFKEDYKKWIMATEVVKKTNPKTKEERIKMFDLIFQPNKLDPAF